MTTVYIRIPGTKGAKGAKKYDTNIDVTDLDDPLERIPCKGETVTVNKKKYTVADVETILQKPDTYVQRYWSPHVVVHLRAKPTRR